MTKEDELIELFRIDREFHDRARLVNEGAVAAAESRLVRFCTECGRSFMPQHPASKFCGTRCLAARERRRYRERIGLPGGHKSPLRTCATIGQRPVSAPGTPSKGHTRKGLTVRF